MPEVLANLIESMPRAWAMPATMIAFAVLLALMWCIPRSHVMRGAADDARWRDLRLWMTALVAVQLGIYAFVG